MEKQAVTLHLPFGLCHDVSFHLEPGECILLAGPNGSGKTTLLSALEVVDSGAENCGRPWPTLVGGSAPQMSPCGSRPISPSDPASTVRSGERFKAHAQLPSPASFIPTNIPKVKGFTVEEFVRTGCYKESDWAGRLSAEMEKRLAESLELLGLKELRTRDISTLSDGEFQKTCIAVGLTRNCSLLMLDEPTAFLDVDGRAMVLEALRKVAENTGICVIFTSHDLHVSLQFCHRVMAFTPDGRFLESDSSNRLEVLQEAFPGAKIA
ncbi:MAG: ABC transporter ATP-binding protein [Bacteroidales bacterium]|nr:ABC transporter ATP-binding protein [Bacteroidales bacterium]